MIRGIQGRGEAHASVGIAHAQAGLALGHRREAEPARRDVAAQPAAIVTLSKQGRALAQQAIEAERAQARGHRAKLAQAPLATVPGGATPAIGSGAGGATEATGSIATRRAMPRGIAKKLATSLSVSAAAAAAPLTPATATPATRTARVAVAETETAVTAAPTRRGPAWGHLIRHGGGEFGRMAAGGQESAPDATTRADRPEAKPAPGRAALHEADARPSARALMQAAAARLVAEARARRDDQKSELAGGPERAAAEPAHAPHEAERKAAASPSPQPASPAVAAAAEQAGLALPAPASDAP